MNELSDVSKIKDRIHIIRGVQVMLDSDLAELYQVETRTINQAVKRNQTRFPIDFYFQLSDKEYHNLKSQIVISSDAWGGKILYHIGASIKDAGKKTFGISINEDEKSLNDLLKRL